MKSLLPDDKNEIRCPNCTARLAVVEKYNGMLWLRFVPPLLRIADKPGFTERWGLRTRMRRGDYSPLHHAPRLFREFVSHLKHGYSGQLLLPDLRFQVYCPNSRMSTGCQPGWVISTNDFPPHFVAVLKNTKAELDQHARFRERVDRALQEIADRRVTEDISGIATSPADKLIIVIPGMEPLEIAVTKEKDKFGPSST